MHKLNARERRMVAGGWVVFGAWVRRIFGADERVGDVCQNGCAATVVKG